MKEPVNGSLNTNGKDAIEMNTFSGELTGYPTRVTGDKISLSFSIPPAGSLLLFIPDIKQNNYPLPDKPLKAETVKSISPLSITPDNENALMIDFCDLKVGNEFIKDYHTYNAADKVYKFFGFKNGNPWNTSVQFRTNTVDRDTFGINTGFTATYHFTIKGRPDISSLKAVVERPWLWTVTINGNEIKPENGLWWLDRSFGVFKIGKEIRPGENSLSLKVSPMKVNAEIEPVYITGNFSVKPVVKGWVIEPATLSYTLGSWQNQGLPFYSRGMTYSKEYNIENTDGKWEVSLGKWNGTIAEVTVNGHPGPLIAFPPYVADITGLIRQGRNKIDIKVIGSLKNLLGPHHNDPQPGFVSPWTWRNVKTYPEGEDYKMVDYGLFEDFTLLKGETLQK